MMLVGKFPFLRQKRCVHSQEMILIKNPLRFSAYLNNENNYALIAQRNFADLARGLVKHSCADGRIISAATSL